MSGSSGSFKNNSNIKSEITIKDFLEGSVIMEKDGVSVRFPKSKHIQFHLLVNDEPTTVSCTLHNLIQPLLDKVKDSENACRISFDNSESITD